MISAGERPQTYALDRVATGTGAEQDLLPQNINNSQHPEVFKLQNLINWAVLNFVIRNGEIMPCSLLQPVLKLRALLKLTNGFPYTVKVNMKSPSTR
jgi:hypothetical protein